MTEAAEDIVQFIKSLGGLHDSVVSNVVWSPQNHHLEIEIENIYSNFEGLPEYSGPAGATFVFFQVTDVIMEVDFTVIGLMIYDWEFQTNGVPNYKSRINFSPSGKTTIECGRIVCVKRAPN